MSRPHTPRNKPITVGGKVFPSQTAAADYFGVPRFRAKYRLERGWPIEAVFGLQSRFHQDSYLVDGESFATLANVAARFGLKERQILLKLERGLSIQAAIDTLRDAVEKDRLRRRARSRRMVQVLRTKREAAGLQRRKIFPCEVDGIIFSNQAELTAHYGLGPCVLKGPLGRGVSPDVAVKTAVERRDRIAKRKAEKAAGMRHLAERRAKRKIEGKVYLITCKLCPQQYVGLTTRSLKRRFDGHVTAAFKGRGGKRTLNEALRQYGPENFKIELLATYDTQEKLAAAEDQWINKQNTRWPHGFNVAKGGTLGGTSGEERVIDGVYYESRRDLARAFGMNYGMLAGRLRAGWTIEQALGKEARPVIRNSKGLPVKHISKGTPRSITAFGVAYPSIKHACAAYGCKPSRFRIARKKGATVEEALTKKPSKVSFQKTTRFRNVDYPSLAAACKALGQTKSAVEARIARGWTLEEALDPSLRQNYQAHRRGAISVEGKTFATMRDVAKHYQIGYGCLVERIRRGASLENAVRRQATPPLMLQGRAYATIAEVAREFNIPARRLRRRLGLGWPLEAAVAQGDHRFKQIVGYNGATRSIAGHPTKELTCDPQN